MAGMANECTYAIESASQILDQHPSFDYDLYYCLNAFKGSQRRRYDALDNNISWCDIDDADLRYFLPQPNILETSPARYQGFWLTEQRVSVDEAEAASRALAYRHGGD